ncbi:hypothetical protein GCM10010172_65680 [Paractinoplanes ferrugineus]|uniref:Fe2OG dioxygenase domain-containing protein n=1 Tax=Paractinoplanes ferrugineus TaxID=113564 RepID=A0A919J1X9_9ACTN|nr:2OG-Fe(II) oxygenase [Actinoplanes ferrugineus]GIE13271.1 hypothetical protein Afe05nite_51110 [Actinoplanes ferrugineus]
MHVAETLTVSSIQGFLDPIDLLDLDVALREVRDDVDRGRLSATARAESVHSIDGFTTAQAMAVYEPQGRDELMSLPAGVTAVLDRAAARALPGLRTVLPSARAMTYWTFVSYTEGQFISPHIDLSDNDPDPDRPKVAGLSICLTDIADYRGGEFFVETACDPDQWMTNGTGTPRVRAECDESSEWYRRQPRTRWRCRPNRGDAVLYGSQMTHGTEPVTAGRIEKFIGFVTA